MSDSRERASFRRSIRYWFARHGRDLPWRHQRTLYRVWVSEIMLQQTQAATVTHYFERFLQVFPDVASLASASEESVLRLWEGLGYYRRARHLREAAQRVMQEHGGAIPCTTRELQSLPGIGKYTAAAILSFALDQPHPVLEANTRRLYARLLGRPTSSAAANEDRRLLEFAERLLPRQRAADWNDALMDLGSFICTPRNPQCSQCPVRRFCSTFERGDLSSGSSGGARRRMTPLQHTAVVVVCRRGHLLMKQQPESAWWPGLWDFVRFPSAPERRHTEAAIRQTVAVEAGIEIDSLEPLPTIRHSVTRYRITLNCYQARCQSPTHATRNGYQWVTPSRVSDLPLTRTARRLATAVTTPSP